MISNSRHEIRKSTTSLLATMAVVLMVINVMLAQQNKRLKAFADGPNRSLELKPGAQLPAIEGMDAEGKRLKVEYGRDARKTLLMVFSPGCRFCGENMRNWEAIANGVDNESYRVIGVSLLAAGTQEYLSRHPGFDRPVIAELDPQIRLAYNLVLSPQTILIDSAGKAEKVWSGLIREGQKRDVEQTLGVQLP